MRLPRLLPEPVTRPILIDPLAFTGALIGAPLVVAILGIWIAFIPVIAVIMGGPLYLVLGVPALLWFIPRYGVTPWKIGALAVVVNALGSAVLIALLTAVNPKFDTVDFALLYLGFGTPHAFAWGLAFGFLYPTFEREIIRALNLHAH